MIRINLSNECRKFFFSEKVSLTPQLNDLLRCFFFASDLIDFEVFSFAFTSSAKFYILYFALN